METQDWIDCDLNELANLERCAARLVQDLEADYFGWWEMIVREEQRLRPIEVVEEAIEYQESPSPRPSLPWYEIVRQIVPRMLFDPFDPQNPQQREIAAHWPRLSAAIEEYAYGLSLPAGVNGPLDVVPRELRERLWEQSARIEPPPRLPSVEGCEILPMEQILPFLKHADQAVRDMAGWYASRFYEDEAAVADQVLEAMEQYGTNKTFVRSVFLHWLTFDDRQFSRLLEILARDSADVDCDTISMVVLLDHFAPELLARHSEDLLDLPWEFSARTHLIDRIEYHDAEPDKLWDAFVGEIERFEEVEGDDSTFHPFDEGMLASITDNLHQDPRLKASVMQVLDTPPTADEFSYVREIAAICLAGELQLEESVPLLVRRMHRDQGMHHCDLEMALSEIRTDAVVSEFHRRLPWGGFTFYQTAIQVLGDMCTRRSQVTLRYWLEFFRQRSEWIQSEESGSDDDLDARDELAANDQLINQVLIAMVRQLMPDGVAAAQEFIEQGQPDGELCEDTLAACQILNVEFPGRFRAEEIIERDRLADDFLDDEDEWSDAYGDFDEFDSDFDEFEDTEGEGWTSAGRRLVQPMDIDDGPPPIEPIKRSAARVGRNDPCPCGSGKKFKKCCLRKLDPEE